MVGVGRSWNGLWRTTGRSTLKSLSVPAAREAERVMEIAARCVSKGGGSGGNTAEGEVRVGREGSGD
jgi:hypothetical protein